MENKTNQNSFIIQGSILAFAGILVRVIGLIYRFPLTRIVGPEGMGYYATAYDGYNILILLSSQSMPLAVSKIVSEKLGKGQYKNSHKVFKGAIIYAVILGTAFGAFAFFGADWLAVSIYKCAPVARALKILAPTLTVACILGVLRGYFQGMGNMVPTAVSQLFEQIVNAFVSIIAAIELMSYATTIAQAENMSAKATTTYVGSFGAVGGTLGTLLGAVAALLIMVIILWKHFGVIRNDIQKDLTQKTDSYSTIIKLIIFTITPVLISTTIYNISNLLDNPIYQNIMYYIYKTGKEVRFSIWSQYSNQFRVLTTMPIAIASALSTAIVPSLVRSYIRNDTVNVTEKVSSALKFSMIIAFPCGIGLSVLGGPVNDLLFDDSSVKISQIMYFSVFTVVVFSLSTISNAILQGIDKLKIPIRNSAISLGLHLVILPILLIVFHLEIFAVVIGDITFGLTVCILNAYSIKKYLGYRQEIKKTLFKPFICSAAMGVGCFIIYHIGMKLFSVNIIWTILSIFVSVFLYAFMLIYTKTVTEEELYTMPKGSILIKILKKFHLL